MRNKAKTMTKCITLLWTRLLILSTIWQMVQLSSVNTTDSEDLQVAEDCTLNITDFESVQELFKEYSMSGEARLVDIRISGIAWSDSSNETVDVFDPDLWSWVAKGSEFLTQMPIDYNILSFGLSRLATMDLELNLTDFPFGCVDQLTFEQQRRLVAKEIIRLTENVLSKGDLICRSTYSQRIWITDPVLGVGRTCCTGDELRSGRPASYDCDLVKAAGHEVKGFSGKSIAITIINILLTFIIIPIALGWWHDKQISFSKDFAKYLSNRLQKWAHYNIDLPSKIHSAKDEAVTRNHKRPMQISEEDKGTTSPRTRRGGSDTTRAETQACSMINEEEPEQRLSESNAEDAETLFSGPIEHESGETTKLLEEVKESDKREKKTSPEEGTVTLLIPEDDLEPYEGPVSILDLLDLEILREVDIGKIKLTFVYVLHLVPVVCWLTYYCFEKETLRRLDSNEKILFNLGGNPYSWLWTDNSLFPYYFAALYFFLNGALFVSVFCWWLLELKCARSLVNKCTTRTLACNAACRPIKPKSEKGVFQAFFYIMVILSYVPVYSLFNSSIYVIGSLIASIDKTLPWLVGGLLVVYYIQQSYQELIQTYTQIKREMFKVCTGKDDKAYIATHVTSVDVISVDNAKSNGESVITDEPDETVEAGNTDQTGRPVKPGEPGEYVITETKNIITCQTHDYKRPVLFAKNRDSKHKNDNRDKDEQKEKTKCDKTAEKSIIQDGAMKYMLSKSTLRGLCREIKPIKKRILKAAIKLVFTLLFIVLVVLTMTVFHSNAATTEARLVITSIPPLLIVLIRWLAGNATTDAEDKLSEDIVMNHIQRLLPGNHPRYIVEVSRREKKDVGGVGRLRRTEVNVPILVQRADMFVGVPADQYEKDGMTQLMHAAEDNDVNKVKSFVNKGADPDLKDLFSGGRTALMHASKNNHKEVVAELIKADAGVNIKDEDGWTALMWASIRGHKEVVAELINAPGADVNIKDKDGRTALMYASMRDRNEVVVELINAPGADVNIQDKCGETALILALEKGDKDGHKKVVSELIKAPGADVNIKDEDGWTALMYASMTGRKEVVAELINAGADVNIIHKSFGSESKCLERNLKKKKKDGATALMYASLEGHKEVVAELIKADAGVNIQDKVGRTALMWASMYRHKEVVAELIQAPGADVNIKHKGGRTALMWASIRGYEEVVAELIQAPGADVNIQDKDGRTALDHAEKEGHVEVAEMLKNAIANTAGDADGRENDASGGV